MRVLPLVILLKEFIEIRFPAGPNCVVISGFVVNEWAFAPGPVATRLGRYHRFLLGPNQLTATLPLGCGGSLETRAHKYAPWNLLPACILPKDKGNEAQGTKC